MYANFTNTVYDRPYAIFIDRKWSTVIISIRGTLSLEDCLADANHEPVTLNRPNPYLTSPVHIMAFLLFNVRHVFFRRRWMRWARCITSMELVSSAIQEC